MYVKQFNLGGIHYLLHDKTMKLGKNTADTAVM